MGRRSRQRGRGGEQLAAPTSDYRDPEGNVLTLRGSLSAATRRQYAQLREDLGPTFAPAAATREDVWHRMVEFLFERLAVRWEIAGVPVETQKQLLQRFRVASQAERAWVREVLREHCEAWFPELRAP